MSGASGLRKHDHSSAGQGGTLAGGGSTLEDVLTAGNDPAGIPIEGALGDQYTTARLEIEVEPGGGAGANVTLRAGTSDGGAGNLDGGWLDLRGGDATGTGTASGGNVYLGPGYATGAGGEAYISGGGARAGSNGNGGDIQLNLNAGQGTGRSGLIIVQGTGLPTADPTVTNALWSDGGTLVQSGFTAGGGGSVATDVIWDAKGDLAGGTGANTAAKLTAGADDTILMADSAASTGLKWVASATPSTQAFGDSAATGTADTFTRGDHKHAMPSLGTTAAAIGTSAGGSAVTPSKSDHVHATGAGTPSTQALGDSAATGSGPAAAMTDHKHAMPAAAVTTSGLTQATNKLLGRSTASTGAIEEITIGTNLSLSGGVLDASGGGGGSVATDTLWDAKGDLAGGTGANTAAKLTVGADGTVLTADSAETTGLKWAAAGALVFLEAHTASSSAQLDFTTFISSTYDTYKIEGVDIALATNAADLRLEIGTGGGPTYDTASNYEWAGNGYSSDGVLRTNVGSTGIPKLLPDLSNNSGYGHGTFSLTATNLQSTAHRKIIQGTEQHVNTAPANVFAVWGMSWNTTATAVTALRFIASSGNIASGTIRIYGVAKS